MTKDRGVSVVDAVEQYVTLSFCYAVRDVGQRLGAGYRSNEKSRTHSVVGDLAYDAELFVAEVAGDHHDGSSSITASGSRSAVA